MNREDNYGSSLAIAYPQLAQEWNAEKMIFYLKTFTNIPHWRKNIGGSVRSVEKNGNLRLRIELEAEGVLNVDLVVNIKRF